MKDGFKSPVTIFFVDVAGSVQLYDSIGDIPAHVKIVECLNHMSSIIQGQGGRVVEIIGDEIMAAFADPDQAVEASMLIQNSLAEETGSEFGVRIGFHSGIIVETDGHPYGDTVNVAARMVNLAKPGQIITNHQTAEVLSEANRARMRVIDKNFFIKGKPNPYDLHEVVWDESDSTQVLTLPKTGYVNRRRTEASLFLKYRGKIMNITESSGEVVLGRGRRCGLVIDSGAASRTHAVVSCRNGMMLIKDQSTNGTFIRTFEDRRANQGIDRFIHHEEWMSDAAGVFSLGEAIEKEEPNIIHFRFS
ncbi:MAG: adenylate/guanylate cyclase domain-containing protein [Methylococcales bacterium]